MTTDARLYIGKDSFEIAMDDCPMLKLGWAMDKLSINGRYYLFPIDREPRRPWVWRFSYTMLDAIQLLLTVSEVNYIELYDAYKQ